MQKMARMKSNEMKETKIRKKWKGFERRMVESEQREKNKNKHMKETKEKIHYFSNTRLMLRGWRRFHVLFVHPSLIFLVFFD